MPLRPVLAVHGSAPAETAVRTRLQAEAADEIGLCDTATLDAMLADGAAPADVVVLLPSAGALLPMGRHVHRRWPEAHLLLAGTPAQLEELQRTLGPAPMLGRHWSLVELEPQRVLDAARQAMVARRRQRKLRTTLSGVSSQVPATRTVSATDYHRLVASEHHLSNILAYVQAPVVGLDRERRVLFWSAGAEQMFARKATEVLGRPVQELPLWGPELRDALAAVARTGRPVTLEVAVQIARGPAVLELVATPVPDSADVAAGGTSLIVRDVTERRRQQDQLRRRTATLEEQVAAKVQELARSERALAQAQKLESIGKLTGGVAHDFNNVLQIIGSNLQLLQATVAGRPEPLRFVQAAMGAVDRGAKLSTQLLAFARRQPLSPIPLDANRRVRDMDDLLRRALGEEIEIQTSLAGGLWTTLADPNQLENVILNLAINARDAMPHGGRLTIETANATLDEDYTHDLPDVAPGPYVLVAVSDTGVGMSAEVLAQVFEPFFTTKPEGQGTGLGLSMAYGFARQSGGHIRIYSEPGAGTTVKLYLPRSFERVREAPASVRREVEGGSETILVVEDDAAVQAAVVDMLTGLGYRVLKADEARSALAILQSGAQVDLLFTDVVMPGPMRSPELALQARQLLPDLAVLFTSGYTQNAIVHGGKLDAGLELLSKPYRREDLARKVRQLLSGREAKPRSSASPAPAPEPASLVPTPSRGILLVEDNADLRESTTEMLRLLDHEVDAAESGEAALQLLAQRSFAVMVTDVTLPGVSGVELAKIARARYPALKIVFCSGQGPVAGAAALGAENLPKPYSLDQLESMMARLVR